MKKLFVLFGLLIIAAVTFAQAPQAFNYQAVVRDADGNLLENQSVGVKISLLQGSAIGPEVYTETHTTNTNQFGQVDLKIGTGTVLTGQFDTIPWNTGNYHLQLSVDLSGGANYQIMGTTQMLSVPYALYAEEGSGWEKTDEGITYLGGKVGIGRTSLTGSNTNLQIGVDDPVDGGVRIFNTDSIENNQALFRIDASANKRNALRVQRDGKIGIGINPPQYTLTFGSTDDRIGFYSDATHYSFIEFYNSQTANMTFKTKNASGGGFIFDGGNVGIGTTNPTYPLTVNGTIRSKKVIVNTGWSDFVFDDDYSLMPLHEVESFIKANRHLPEIPSAKEVEENGVSLGEISASLLQKIEELTLYTIEQQKVIEELVEQNEEMIKKVNKLERKSDRKRNKLTK
jgi:hypothetical protein